MNTKTERDEDIAKVKALGHMGECDIFMREEGGGNVFRIWDTLFLFEIPQYGGQPRFQDAYGTDDAEKLVDCVHSWT